MQNEMRERMMAQQIARGREMFTWLSSFYVIASIGMVRGYKITRKPVALAPLLPLTFLVAYQADLAYGTKVNRIKTEAENILMFERDLIESPLGLPTIGKSSIESVKTFDTFFYKYIA